MSATQTAATLFQLQQFDLELDRLASEAQVIVNSLQGNALLQKLRSEYTSSQQGLQAGLQAQKEAEWTLEDISTRLKTQEQRLYNGTTGNAKELQSLQLEVQRLRAQQSRQEDVVLEVLDAAESLQEIVTRKQRALTEAEENWQQESAKLVSRRDQVAERRQEVQTKRGRLAASIDGSLLERYEKMRKLKQGRAVSKVEQDSCQWCRVILTPSELQQVRINAELQLCSNCGRILYYDR
jgi:predicted  nucleic acid-binding Zn-ribbon protein